MKPPRPRGRSSLLTRWGSVADIAGAENARADPMTNSRRYTGPADGALTMDQLANAARQSVLTSSESPMILRRSNRSAA